MSISRTEDRETTKKFRDRLKEKVTGIKEAIDNY